MSCHTWLTRRIAPAALACAALFLLAIVGCGGEGKTEPAVVIPSEPIATGTATSSGTGGAAPAPAPASTTAPGDTTAPAGASAEGWGTIKGRVVYSGDPPAPKTLLTDKDPQVCAKTPHLSERVVVDPGTKGVKYAIVYVFRPSKVNPEAKKRAESTNAEFDQKECTFDPHVLAVMKGAKIILKSSDPIQHNIDAKLKANSTYNNLLAPASSTTYEPLTAERGPVEVVCDIHSWMKAWWLILDNPYFAVTDDKGNFEIKDVPAGGQKLVVWQEALDKEHYLTPKTGDTISVKANETTTLPDFKIEPSRVQPE
jgi:plastocyanin